MVEVKLGCGGEGTEETKEEQRKHDGGDNERSARRATGMGGGDPPVLLQLEMHKPSIATNAKQFNIILYKGTSSDKAKRQRKRHSRLVMILPTLAAFTVRRTGEPVPWNCVVVISVRVLN